MSSEKVGSSGVPDLFRAGADDAGTTRAEQPLVGAGNEEVAVHVREVEVVDAEAVDPVDHIEDAVLVVAIAVLLFHQLADLANRQLDPAARLYPGHAQDPGLRLDGAGDIAEHFIGRDLVGVLEQADLAHAGAFAFGAQPQGVAGRVMLVLGGENFLVGAHMDAAVDHRQAFGGAAGQGDLARLGLQVASSGLAHLVFALPGFGQVPVHCQARVAIDGRAMALDGVAYGLGVAGDQEVGEVQVVRILVEQLAQSRPFVAALRGGGGRCGGGGQVQAGTERQAGGEQACLLEKGSAVSHE